MDHLSGNGTADCLEDAPGAVQGLSRLGPPRPGREILADEGQQTALTVGNVGDDSLPTLQGGASTEGAATADLDCLGAIPRHPDNNGGSGSYLGGWDVGHYRLDHDKSRARESELDRLQGSLRGG